MANIKFVDGDGALVAEVTAADGSNLREQARSNSVDMYKFWDKVKNCGGVGQCATCIVNVVEGMENLSTKTEFEQFKLRKKPETYRLGCQTVVNGSVTVQIKPGSKSGAKKK
jgi:ferredoxin